MADQPIPASKLLTALRACPVALTLDEVDQFGLEGGEVKVAFSAVFVEEGCRLVADEEAVGWEGAAVAGGLVACEGLLGRVEEVTWRRRRGQV